MFKKRDTESWDRDFCVYIFEDEFGIEQYYGMGRYYDLTRYNKNKWLNRSRPFKHKNDLLSNCVNSEWTCRIVGLGMTSLEAHVLEAHYIVNCNRNLSKIKAKEWDRKFLINKRRERKWEKLMSEYLNFNNGNNTRIAA